MLAPDDVPARLVHAGEGRVVVGAQPAREVDDARVGAAGHHRLDERGVVDGEQVVVAGVGRVHPGEAVEDAEVARERRR